MQDEKLFNEIRRLPDHVMLVALPDFRPFCDVRWDVIQDFVRHVSASRTKFATWQAAFNSWSGAGPSHAGRVTVQSRCGKCKGRRLDLRFGTALPCQECRGIGRARRTSRAVWQNPS